MSTDNNKNSSTTGGNSSGGEGLVRQSAAISGSGVSKSGHKSNFGSNQQHHRQQVIQPTASAVDADGVNVPPVPNTNTSNTRSSGSVPVAPHQHGNVGNAGNPDGGRRGTTRGQATATPRVGTGTAPAKQTPGIRQFTFVPAPTMSTSGGKQVPTAIMGKPHSSMGDDVPIPDFDIAVPTPVQQPQRRVVPWRNSSSPKVGTQGKVGNTGSQSKRVTSPSVKQTASVKENHGQQQFQNILQRIRGGGVEGVFTRIIIAFQIAGVYLSQGRILGLLGVIGDWIYKKRVPFLCVWAILFLLIGFFVNRYVSWGGGLILVILGTVLGNRRDDYDGFPFIFVGILIYLVPFFV